MPATRLGTCCRQSLADSLACRLDYSNNRAIRKQRTRRLLIPDRARSVHSDVIPHNASAVMFSHGFGDESLLVPKLSHARVGNPPKRRCGRRSPICR